MKPLAWRWGLLPLLALASLGWSHRAVGSVLRTQPTFGFEVLLASNEPVRRSRELYEAGQFSEAAEILERVADAFAAAGDNRARAIALSNLSLAYQQLGEWSRAQGAIATSCEALVNAERLLDRSPEEMENPCRVLVSLQGNADPILAQILQVWAQLQLTTGQADVALETWKQAAEIYEALDDDGGRFSSQINQAQALQAMGFYRRSLKVLAQVQESLRDRPDSALKAQTLLGLGNTLRVVGQLASPETPQTDATTGNPRNSEETTAAVEETDNATTTPQVSDDDTDDYEANLNAIEVLSESLEIATRLNLPELQAKAELSLGNTAQSLAQRAKESRDRFSADRRENDPSERNWEYYNQRYERQLGEALLKYQSAANLSGISPQTCINVDGESGVDPQTCIDAQLNTLRLWVEKGEWEKTRELIPELQKQIERQTPGRFSTNARVNLAQSAIDIFQSAPSQVSEDISADIAANIAQLLQEAVGEARSLEDSRAESFALGTLGKLYQLTGQFVQAQEVTEMALKRSHAVRASSISYQWQWQLGQVLRVQNQPEEAIAAYSQAVTTLKTLRGDLAAISPDLQFSFRDSIEPIYREFVDVLLQHPEGEQVSPENLKLARDTIEALQLAELDNFFREACIDADPKQIDNVDPKAAVIYSIVIDDRLEIIAALPSSTNNPDAGENEPTLHHQTTKIDPEALNNLVSGVQDYTRSIASPEIQLDVQPNKIPDTGVAKDLKTDASSVNEGEILDSDGKSQQCFGGGALLTCYNRTPVLESFQKIYDSLVRPIETELAASEVETLVFVLDGVLRNVPMSVLHDGEQYLIEKYAIALTPGLQLLSVNPIQEIGLTTLAAGLIEMPDKPHAKDFGNLPAVKEELDAIEQQDDSQVLRGENFTTIGLQNNITAVPSAIVHLATHGQFSSNAEDTYILSWDALIEVDSLNRLLRSRDGRKTAIELLVLSACETAVGDDRAALGLAGVAVRAGARSTVASLWAVNDRSTALLMTQFYQELQQPGISKAQALRNAQLSFLAEDSPYRHPLYWGAFVLVGNWK